MYAKYCCISQVAHLALDHLAVLLNHAFCDALLCCTAPQDKVLTLLICVNHVAGRLVSHKLCFLEDIGSHGLQVHTQIGWHFPSIQL